MYERAVSCLVFKKDGDVSEDVVEPLAVVAFPRNRRLLVTEGHNPLCLCGHFLLQHTQFGIDRLKSRVLKSSRQPAIDRIQGIHAGVNMRVHQSWQNQVALQIDDGCRVTDEWFHIIGQANLDKTAVPDGNRLRPWLLLVDRVDSAVRVDRVCSLLLCEDC